MSNTVQRVFLYSSLATLLLSCTPVIYYLGDTYPPSSSVAVYYDAREVKQEYRTIGRMTKELSYQTEQDKKHMIEAAKKKGADGIIFSELGMQSDKKQSSTVSVKAELIKFL